MNIKPPLRPDMAVRQLAADYPECQAVLRRYGEPDRPGIKFGHLEPLERFAKRQRIDCDRLLRELAFQWRLRSRPAWQGRPADFARGGWQSDRPCGDDALLELAVFGFALNAIYGFGLRLLSRFRSTTIFYTGKLKTGWSDSLDGPAPID